MQQPQNGSHPGVWHTQNNSLQKPFLAPYQTYVRVQPEPVLGSRVQGHTGSSVVTSDVVSVSAVNGLPPYYYEPGRRALVVGSGFGAEAPTEPPLHAIRGQRGSLGQQGAHVRDQNSQGSAHVRDADSQESVGASGSDVGVAQVRGLSRIFGNDAAAGIVCDSIFCVYISWCVRIFWTHNHYLNPKP